MKSTVIIGKGGKGGVRPDWFADVVEKARTEPGVTLPRMESAGCQEIRSAVLGADLVLTFVWNDERVSQAERSRLIAFWAARVPGMGAGVSQAEVAPSGLTGELRYVPDVYGQPCTPPTKPVGAV
jgi:hypothetical protein